MHGASREVASGAGDFVEVRSSGWGGGWGSGGAPGPGRAFAWVPCENMGRWDPP